MALDIHNYQRRVSQILEKIRSDEEISDRNRALILKYHQHLEALGISPGRVMKYLYTLRSINGMMKTDFSKATKDDVEKFVQKLEKSDYKDNTKKDFKVVTKRFWQWMKECPDKKYPEEVDFIRCTLRNACHKLPQKILTEEEVKKIIMSTDNPRDRALVSVLYESGCRIQELLNLRIGDIEFDSIGAKFVVDGKTGQRQVRAIASQNDLRNWIESNPFKTNPNAFVWIVLGDRNKLNQMGYAAVNLVLRKLAKRCGITKPVNPHAFRHARATHLASILTESQLKQIFGWSQGSSIAATYVHLSGRDVDDALAKLNGQIVQPKKTREKFALMKCPRCGHKNSPSNRYCAACSYVLDQDELRARQDIDGMEERLTNNVLQEFFSKKHPELREEYDTTFVDEKFQKRTALLMKKWFEHMEEMKERVRQKREGKPKQVRIA